MILKENAFIKIRQDVENYIGQEIDVKSSIGRNKVKNVRGIIEGVNANQFLVRRSDIQTRESFNYADVLTNSLEITSVDSGEQLLNYEFDTSKKIVQL